MNLHNMLLDKVVYQNLNNFPFAAIIGQAEMKLALQLNVIDPKIGGVI